MAGDRNDSGRPNAGRRRTRARGLGGLLVSLAVLALGLPAASQAAVPNPGMWESTSYAWDFTFTVDGSKTALSGFDPPRSNWSCGGTYVWTDLNPISAAISGGAFTQTVSGPISGLSRSITATLSGQFTAPDRASGTLSESLTGCTPQTHSWSAFGPATVYPDKAKKKKKKAKKKKRKKKKKGKNKGDGDGDSGDICIPVQLPDGWIICV